MSGEYITVAKVTKTQGRIGEVFTALFTDFPERFAERKVLHALAANGERKELKVEDHWPHKDGMVFKFAGVDSMNDAEALLGSELQVPAAERTELEAGAAYISDLVGCAVFDGQREVGRVKEVAFGAGEAPTLVIGEGQREHLVPFAESFLRKVDVAGKRIEMELPEGLLEVDAPLTEEEKKQQGDIGG